MNERNGKNVYQINKGNLNTMVDKSFLDQQRWYLSSNALKVADLVIKGSLFHTLAIDWSASRVLLLLSIPVVHWMAMRHAEKNDYVEKNKLRSEWNESMYIQKWTAYRQKWLGVRKDENGSPTEKELKGEEKFVKIAGKKIPAILPIPVLGGSIPFFIPIPYAGAIPGLLYDSWVVIKLTGVTLFYISKYTVQGLAAAAQYTLTRVFSYDKVDEPTVEYGNTLREPAAVAPTSCMALF
jgi:hypothetical protein